MGYLEFFVGFAFCFVFLFLLDHKNSFLPWNWPIIKLIPTAYFKGHELYEKITQILAENKGTVFLKTFWFTNVDILLTSDPANVQHVMNTKYSIYQRGSEFRDVMDFLGEAAFIKNLDEWREDKKFTHAFYKENDFHKCTPKIIQHTLENGLIPVLDHLSQHDQVLDLQTLFNRYMLDATCIMATGFDLGSLRVGFPRTPLLDAMDDIGEAVFLRHIQPQIVWKLQRWLVIGKEKKMAEACKTLNQILRDYVSEKCRLVAKNQENKENFDVLKFYLAEASGKQTEKAFLAANIMTLLFAGRDTSGALLTWFFYLISRNPLAEEKILQEIKQNFPSSEKHLFSNVDELSKLVYLQAALSESLRLFPAAPVIIRNPTQEDVLPSGHKINPTTKVILCSYAMARTPEIWGGDCREFKPERWISGKGGIKHMPGNNYLAFGSGPWACPGRELAFTRMKAVAATILHNYQVHVMEGQSISPSVSAILTVKNGLKAKVSSRWI